MIVWGYIAAFGYALLCIALGYAVRKMGLPQFFARKVVHICVGFEWVILGFFLGTSLHYFIVCLCCFILLFLSYRLGWFGSAMGSDGDNAPGTVLYGLSMTVMAAVMLWNADFVLPFGIAVACTSLGDGAAGVIGYSVKNHNPVLLGSKTLYGTLSCAAVCTFCAWGFSLYFSMGLLFWQCLLIGVLAAGAELISRHGLDNVLVPLLSAALTWAFLYIPDVTAYLVPLVATPYVVAFALRGNALTRSGLIAALLLDLVFSVTLGNTGFLLLCLFFFGGVLCDRIGRKAKRNILASKEEKGSRRDAVQVLVNAAPAAICAVLYVLTGNVVFLAGVLGGLAEALGDTAASGIGVLSKHTYDIFRMRPCERGISGGMSFAGTCAALIGCTAVGIFGTWQLSFSWWQGATVVLLAFFGTVIDSMLGSLFQRRLRCTVCGHVTERSVHCGTKTVRIGGFAPINNDAVNLLSSLLTCSICVIAALLFW